MLPVSVNRMKMHSIFQNGKFKGQKRYLFRKFTRKSLQVKQMNKLLLENDKTHYMNTRNREPF